VPEEAAAIGPKHDGAAPRAGRFVERSRCRAGTSGTVRCAFSTADHGRGLSTDGPRDHDDVDDLMDAPAGPHPGARSRWADGAAGGEAQEAAPFLTQLVTFPAAGGTPESDGTVGAWHEPPEALLAWWRRVCAEEAAQEGALPADLDAIAWTADERTTTLPREGGKGGPGGGSPPASPRAPGRRG
jgi:hypothetical protein